MRESVGGWKVWKNVWCCHDRHVINCDACVGQEADWCLRVNFPRNDHMVCDDFWDKLLVRQSATVFAGIKEKRKMKCETGFHANIVIQITLTGLRRKEVTKQTNHYVLGQYNLLCKHEHLASFYIFFSSWFESWQKESKSKLRILSCPGLAEVNKIYMS